MPDLALIGKEWLLEQVEGLEDSIKRMGPIEYNELNRYLPQGVSPRPGYIRYDLFPFLIEIIENFDPLSPVRETNLKKGVQTGFTTLLESIMLYYIGHIKTQPMMYLTADKELANVRMENNILPMLVESEMMHLIRSADTGNFRKTGKTKDFLQFDGGGYMIYNGAQNATKMRQNSVPLMFKDELDGWKLSIGKDGNSDTLTDARLSAYWDTRKILRGSTPLTEPSMIDDAYEKGDKRKYNILCRACSFPQHIHHNYVNKETGLIGGFKWETEHGRLIIDSVRYRCIDCGHEHYEHDKEYLFAIANGAHWKPTAEPRVEFVRSYHLPAWYSPFGFRPWHKGISDYLECFDPETKEILSISKYQEYVNNTLGDAFKSLGSRIYFTSASAHRRSNYSLGEIPNKYAAKYSRSEILFLVCMVDVHKRNLAVTVFGICKDLITYVIDYWRFERENEDDDCGQITSPVWGRLQALIEEKIYTADNGREYRIAWTFVDAGWSMPTVVTFCSQYGDGVHPIVGRQQAGKNQQLKEFREYKTTSGKTGYMITVDHYKDRLAPVLRRTWAEEQGVQPIHHFNAPVDLTDKQIKELTVESRKEMSDENGATWHIWHRPGNAANELFDNLGYAHACVEIMAYLTCIGHFELETIDWGKYWDYLEAQLVEIPAEPS